VYEISGRPLTDFFQETQNNLPYNIIKLVIAPENRAILHEKIAIRFKQMLANHFIDEVESLYQRKDLTPALPAIRAVGYRQAWSYLEGEYDLAAMTEKAIIATRQLAKRQFTWLRRETQAHWLVTESENLLSQALEKINFAIED
jgi:tRNA dimethylallyltransferase